MTDTYHFHVSAVLWEREPLVAAHHFQHFKNIPPPSTTDIVVVVLWSRLGVELEADAFSGAISGRTPVTGTEWEFEDALQASRTTGTPDLLFYRKTARMRLAPDDDAEALEQSRQKSLVADFLQRWFYDASGTQFTAAFHEVPDATEFEERLETHLRALLRRRLEGADGSAQQTGIRWHQNPFRGLESFEPEHAQIFFGRTQARNELRELVARQAQQGRAFVLVMGASGSGKSSLVKAGLLPDLMLPGMVGRVALCRYAIFRPSQAEGGPAVALAAALLARTALPELAEAGQAPERLAERLVGGTADALEAVRSALASAATQAGLTEKAEARLVVLVDQLEELFTNEAITPQVRRTFIGILGALAHSGFVWVIATMRSDFFDRLESVPELATLSAGEGRYLLLPPSDHEIGQMIRQPASEAGLRFEVDEERGLGLDEVLREAASRHPTALPLLEYTLDELGRRKTGTGLISFAAYAELGGFEGAVGQRAEAVLAGLPEEVRATFPTLLRALVSVGQGLKGTATARHVALGQFAPGTGMRTLVDAFLAPEARLLVAEGDGEGARVRVAHEALLTHWPRARDQIAEDRSDLQLRARLEQAVALWQAADAKDRDALLLRSGLPLSEAEDLLVRLGGELHADLAAFIRESGEAARRQEHNRLKRLRTALFTFAFLTIVAGVAAWLAYGKSREAADNAAEANVQRNTANREREQAQLQEKMALTQRNSVLTTLARNHLIEGDFALALQFLKAPFEAKSEPAASVAPYIVSMLGDYAAALSKVGDREPFFWRSTTFFKWNGRAVRLPVNQLRNYAITESPDLFIFVGIDEAIRLFSADNFSPVATVRVAGVTLNGGIWKKGNDALYIAGLTDNVSAGMQTPVLIAVDLADKTPRIVEGNWFGGEKDCRSIARANDGTYRFVSEEERGEMQGVSLCPDDRIDAVHQYKGKVYVPFAFPLQVPETSLWAQTLDYDRDIRRTGRSLPLPLKKLRNYAEINDLGVLVFIGVDDTLYVYSAADLSEVAKGNVAGVNLDGGVWSDGKETLYIAGKAHDNPVGVQSNVLIALDLAEKRPQVVGGTWPDGENGACRTVARSEDRTYRIVREDESNDAKTIALCQDERVDAVIKRGGEIHVPFAFPSDIRELSSWLGTADNTEADHHVRAKIQAQKGDSPLRSYISDFPRLITRNGSEWSVLFRGEGSSKFGSFNMCVMSAELTPQRCEQVVYHGNAGKLVVAPDKTYVFISDMKRIGHPAFHVINLATATRAKIPEGPEGTTEVAGFNAGGTTLAILTEYGEIWIYRRPSDGDSFSLAARYPIPPGTTHNVPEWKQRDAPDPRSVRALAIPDDRHLLLLHVDSGVTAVRIADGGTDWTLSPRSLAAEGILPVHDAQAFLLHDGTWGQLYSSEIGAPITGKFPMNVGCGHAGTATDIARTSEDGDDVGEEWRERIRNDFYLEARIIADGGFRLTTHCGSAEREPIIGASTVARRLQAIGSYTSFGSSDAPDYSAPLPDEIAASEGGAVSRIAAGPVEDEENRPEHYTDTDRTPAAAAVAALARAKSVEEIFDAKKILEKLAAGGDEEAILELATAYAEGVFGRPSPQLAASILVATPTPQVAKPPAERPKSTEGETMPSTSPAQASATIPPPTLSSGSGGNAAAGPPSTKTQASGSKPSTQAMAVSGGQTLKDCDVCPEMVVVPAGSFTMGSPDNEPGRGKDEGPQHRVTIDQPFAAGKYPVTFAEWDACVVGGGCNGYSPNDEGWGRGRRPVINVSWDDAKAYVSWLSRKTGQEYRLLAEAEREYVTRAGTSMPFWTGSTISTSQANFDGTVTYNGSSKGTYRERTVEVGSFKANAFGQYDVHGNVWDWIEDCWHDSYKGAPTNGAAWTSGSCQRHVLRGGSWSSTPRELRSANRSSGVLPDFRDYNIGFRVARTLTP